jgi:hypothetical protein
MNSLANIRWCLLSPISLPFLRYFKNKFRLHCAVFKDFISYNILTRHVLQLDHFPVLVTPPPPTPHLVPGEGAHSLAGEGVGVSHFRRCIVYMYFVILSYYSVYFLFGSGSDPFGVINYKKNHAHLYIKMLSSCAEPELTYTLS